MLPHISSLHPQNHQQRRGYHENIIEHYENPRNVGSLDKNDDNVGTVSLIFMFLFVSSERFVQHPRRSH